MTSTSQITIDLNRSQQQNLIIENYRQLIQKNPEYHQKSAHEIKAEMDILFKRKTIQLAIINDYDDEDWKRYILLSAVIGVTALTASLAGATAGLTLGLMFSVCVVGLSMWFAVMTNTTKHQIAIEGLNSKIYQASEIIDTINHLSLFTDTLPEVELSPEIEPNLDIGLVAKEPPITTRISNFFSRLINSDTRKNEADVIPTLGSGLTC